MLGKGFDSIWNGSRRLCVPLAVGVAPGLASSSGGSGKTAYSLGGPVSFSGSVSSFADESALRELLRDGGARTTEAMGPKLSDSGDRIEPDDATVGLVPARFLDGVSCEEVCVVTMKGVFRSCAAENEGRKRRRAAIDPLISGNEARSSSFADGPEEGALLPRVVAGAGGGKETADSVVLTSVDPLPLLFRRR